MKRLLSIAILVGLCAAGGVARAQFAPTTPQARMQLDRQQPYAGMPFQLVVVAEGFDTNPKPTQPTLAIPNATVTPLGVEGQPMHISINGQSYDQVTWVFRYRVQVDQPGDLTAPPVTIVQGQKKATAQGGPITVTSIDTTDDMKIEVHLPDRPLWLGENAEVQIDWLLRSNVHDQQLSVPLLAMPNDFAITAPPATDPRQVLAFPAGASDLQLPYVQDKTNVGGVDYVRFRFNVEVTPQHAGTITVPPAQVVASLEVGQTRDQFGFPSARTQLFRASDVAHTLEVKPLPLTGRPASFSGAVGSSFSIATQSSRSVVQLGEPVELDITVKGDTRLDGLALGALAGPTRLPATKFQIPDQLPPGELSDDGKTKTFKVSVQVTDPSTTEIPPIELAWFDPATAQYRTARSEPIALSVKGGTVVGAGDVVGGHKPSAPTGPATVAPTDVSLVGADLALSAPGAALHRPFGGAVLWGLIAALYLIPLGVFGLRMWQVRTAGAREEKGEVASARRRVDEALAKARTAPARDVAATLTAALRTLGKLAGAGDDPLLERIESDGFAPGAGDRPLAEGLRREAAALSETLAGSARARPRGRGAAAVVVLLAALGASRGAQAATPSELIDQGRDAYQQAMNAPDPTARQAAFARAEAAFAEAAAQRTDSAELDADWGNAALGAADFGTATLAFRRALRLDADQSRASRNLAWLRSRLPDNLRPPGSGAAARLFFFAGWSRAMRLVAGALAFAIALLLVVPWRRRPGASRLGLAALPLIAWLLLTGSVVLEGDASADGVIVDSEVLRSADSLGAPAATMAPLPPGAEITIVEQRDGWTRIRTAGGVTGWLPERAVAPVAP